jgi:galactokinase
MMDSAQKHALDAGFAGTVQAFVPFEILEQFRAGMDSMLGEGACHVLRIRTQGGAEMICE